MGQRKCSRDDCDNPHQAKGLCWKHYARLRRTGTADNPEVPPWELPGERWEFIPGTEDLYQASDLGRVRSLPREDSQGRPCGGTVLSPYIDVNGYAIVRVSIGDFRKRPQQVHRLVMLAFVGACPPGLETRHLDGNPSNNRWAPGDEEETQAAGGNLIYGTPAENAQDKKRHGTDYNANKTHCPKGHEYTPENTYIVPGSGGRACKQCWRVEEKKPHYLTLRTHCPQGHEYTPQNTITYRTSRSCRTCANERARAKYAAEKAKRAA